METRFQPPHLFCRSNLIQVVILLVVCVSLPDLQAYSQAPAHQDLARQIQTYAALSTRAEPPLMEPLPAGRVWSHLGSLYEDAAMYTQSEMAYLHAIRLLKTSPPAARDLARAMDDLGTLYMMRGETELAERLEQQALAMRQSNELTADLPRSWYHLATLSLREHRDQEARDYARRAVTQLEGGATPGSEDEINARFVVGLALCRLRQYSEAQSEMQTAMDIVRRSYRPNEFPVGFGSFLQGYVDWKAGNRAQAGNLMQDGESVVEKQLGPRHPTTLSILNQYQRFLEATHQKKAAHAVEKHLKQAREQAGPWQSPEALSVASMF